MKKTARRRKRREIEMRKREELDVSDGEDPDTMTIMMTRMKMEHVFNLSPAHYHSKPHPLY